MSLIPCPLHITANEQPDDPAVIHGDIVISYQQLNTAVTHTIQNLRDHNVTEGRRFAIFVTNNVDYIIILLAAWRLKAVPCLLSTRLTPLAIQQQLQFLNCVCCISNIADLSGATKTGIPLLKTSEITQKTILSEKFLTFEYEGNQDADIMFTSGSTGTPKAALHSIQNHYYNALGSNEHIPLNRGDRWLLTLPLYHVGGLSLIWRTLLAQAALVIPEQGINLHITIPQKRITHISLVAAQLYQFLLNKETPKILQPLKCILLGGSAIPQSLITEIIQHKLPAYLTYGLTEMGSQVATTEKLTAAKQDQGAKILNYRQVKINDDREIYVKGNTLFKGYIQSNGMEQPLSPDGWYATGDLGELTKAGFLKITGRKDNMFISGGENIQPEEIETILCQFKNIRQAVVVPKTDETFGHCPVAFLRIEEKEELTQKELEQFLTQFLPKFKIPKSFYAWPTYIKDTEIKVNRSRLIDLIQNENPDLIKIS